MCSGPSKKKAEMRKTHPDVVQSQDWCARQSEGTVSVPRFGASREHGVSLNLMHICAEECTGY